MDLNTISRSDSSDFKLGDWWIRPQRNELERAGETAHVEARSMQVLVCLGRHAPAVVSKACLLEEVWSDSPYIGDDVISHAIWELRKALGDSAREPAYIQTVPRKGYRLLAEILRPQGSPVPIEGVRIDHYDLGKELGRGAMGVVYEAVDRRLGRSVAVKFLAAELARDTKATRRFQREARLAASLDHPNLGTVYEVGETSKGHPYLVSAYYSGGSLKDRLAEGPLEVTEALHLFRQLVAGLDAAHQRDIVHRDIKPANLLLDEHGTLKICDFGIAKLLGATDLTHTGATLGTPAYKSPEQTQGQDVDHRTDLWSAGVVLCELLSGRRLFDGEDHAIVHSILSRQPRIMEDAHGRPVPRPLRYFIARTLAKKPAERFQNAEQMTVALDELEEAQTLGARSGLLPHWKFIAAGFLAAALAFAALWYAMDRDPRDGETEHLEPGSQAYLAQGRSLWLRGNHSANLQEVREHFEKAVELSPNSVEAKGHLAVFLAEKFALHGSEGDQTRAREMIRDALMADPKASLALAAESLLLILDGKPVEGERQAQKALGLEPACKPDELCDLAYAWFADALYMQDRDEEAFKILEEGIHVGGGRIRCRLKRAQLYEKSGKKRAAENDYREVLQLDQTQTTALQELANLYMKARRFGEAMPIQRLIYQTTRDPRALSNIGYIQYHRQVWDEAITTYHHAHLAYQDSGVVTPTPLTAIGDVYLEIGMKKAAQEQYKQALEIFDSLEQPGIRWQARRAVCLAKLDLFDEAEKKIQTLLSRNDLPDLLFYAARIYALKRDRETLLDLARQWAEKGGEPQLFQDDPAFIPYRLDREYLNILEPGLIQVE